MSEQLKREACGQGNFFFTGVGVGDAGDVAFDVWVAAEWEVGLSESDVEVEVAVDGLNWGIVEGWRSAR